MPVDALSVEHLFTLEAETRAKRPVTIAGGPQGTRLIATVTGGSFAGARLRGVLADTAAGDWVTSRPDGSFRLDVRLTLLTDDGAAVLMTYSGIGTTTDGATAIRTAPQFETGDERYAWLNRIQAVGVGELTKTGVRYEVYALR